MGIWICRLATEVVFGGAGQLQRHQEVGRLPDTARQAVLHGDDGRTARARAQRDVIEAQLERAVDGDGAAEAHAAEHRELAAPFEQQPDDLQKILVPADRDAVLGDTAEARHHAIVERLVELLMSRMGGNG